MPPTSAPAMLLTAQSATGAHGAASRIWGHDGARLTSPAVIYQDSSVGRRRLAGLSVQAKIEKPAIANQVIAGEATKQIVDVKAMQPEKKKDIVNANIAGKGTRAIGNQDKRRA